MTLPQHFHHHSTPSSSTQTYNLLLANASHLNQTDVSRSQALELQIQARVAAELKRLQEEEAAALRAAEEKLSASSPEDDSKPSRQAVSKEVEALKQKLESRRKVREIPASVEAARGEVVRCLRENDRRPLDCWKEVEAFKEEVRRLEKGWVEKVVG
jgi:altered-inheritance-of-mitochondria protein 13